MECLTSDSLEDNTEDNIGDINTDTPETEVYLDEVSKREAEEDEIKTLKGKIEVLERKFEKAEETITTLNKEKSEDKETINTLTKEKSEAEDTINTLTKEKSEATQEYKLKVETLVYEVAKLREELRKSQCK